MKNHALRWGLVVSLLLTMFTFSAGVAQAAESTMPVKPECTHKSGAGHGGWSAFPASGNLSAGTYYLDGNLTVSGTIRTGTAAGDNVTVCLNGNTITHTGDSTMFRVTEGTTLTICDCGGTGAISKKGRSDAVAVVAGNATLNMFNVNVANSLVPIVRAVGSTTVKLVDCVFTDAALDVATRSYLLIAGTNATFDLHNCTIQNVTLTSSKAQDMLYGAMFTQAGATVNMKDTTISGVKLAEGSDDTLNGAVHVAAGATLNMYDGCAIEDNDTNGVYLAPKSTAASGAAFNMYGGTISGNEASDGAGVRMLDYSTFTMNGGTISGNTASNYGGGVLVADGAHFYMNGGTIGGTSPEATNSANWGGGVCAMWYAQGGRVSYFDMTGGTIIGNEGKVAEDCDGVLVQSSHFNMSGGEIVGHGMNNARKTGVKLNGGSFTMSGTAVIRDFYNSTVGGGVNVVKGTFNMSGGTIRNNKSDQMGGGVSVASNCVFNMTGGTINGNTSAGKGGGVLVRNGSTFNMDGGTISGNTSTEEAGGGVYNSGTFYMKKGSITGNILKAAKTGAGVYVNGTFTMDNGTISGNQSAHPYPQGLDVAVDYGKFTMNDGVIGDPNDAMGKNYALGALVGAGLTPEVVINDGTIASTYFCKLTAADRATSYATVTFNGGTVLGWLGRTAAGGVDYKLNGGMFWQSYKLGYSTYNNTTASDTLIEEPTGNYNSFTLGEGMQYTKYDGMWLVAAKNIGTNMNLGETLNVNFHLSAVGPTVAKAYVTIEGKEEVEVSFKNEDGKYVITVPNVAATEMAKTISLVLKDAKGNVVNAASDSIKAYGERVLKDENMAEAHTVIVDMLNYGAAAQQYFNVNADVLANAGFDDQTKDKATDIGTALDDAQKDSSISYAGSRAYSYANLTLDDMVDFNLYFWVDQIGEENKTYTYSVNDGAAKPGTFSEYLDADQENPVLYTLKVENLTIADLAEAKVTVTFYEKGQEKTITDSVFNYLARTDGASKFAEDGKDNSGLSQYLVAFAASAKEYAGDPDLGENETPIG